jgi:hypothetical protein
MMANSVYSCDQLIASYVIGTVSNGVLFWPPKERLSYFQNKGLSNNTVLSLFEDADKIFGWD